MDGIWKLERGGGVGLAGRKRRQRVEVEVEVEMGPLHPVLKILFG